jgi:HSP20 family protein
MSLIKNSPSRGFLFPSFTDFFGRDLSEFNSGAGETIPSVNIHENESGFTIELAAPGLKREDFKIELDHNVLKISASKETKSEENQGKTHRREFSYSSFSRSFTLPNSVDYDAIEASYSDGLLSLNLPKKEEAKRKGPKGIEVK